MERTMERTVDHVLLRHFTLGSLVFTLGSLMFHTGQPDVAFISNLASISLQAGVDLLTTLRFRFNLASSWSGLDHIPERVAQAVELVAISQALPQRALPPLGVRAAIGN